VGGADNPRPGTQRPLEALNFFMADMQAGIGPFLGIFLAAHGWKPGPIGAVMTMGGVAGTLVTAPAGALVDETKRKRTYVIGSGICTVLASALILYSQRFWIVAGSQVATAIAGAAIGPAVTAMTLGIVRQRGFNRQNGRNQAFNHAGNMVGAGVSGLLGWKFGLPAIFGLAAAFGVLSIVSVLMVPRDAIDDDAARGMAEGADGGQVRGFAVLFQTRPLLVLAACLMFFHLGNGALLPLYGLAVSQAHQGNPSQLVALTIVVAQAVMIVASIVAMRLAEKSGYWLVILITFIALPIRGLVASSVITWWGIYPEQILDGVAAGLQSVAVPGLVARVLDGAGRVNVGQGAVMTVQGVGAGLSPALGGWLAQAFGFPAAFAILGSLSVGSILLWVAFAGILKPACAARRQKEPEGDPTAGCA
jgi:MFS family permease